jgi:hypothetical protein
MKTKNETDLLYELIITTKKKRAYELELVKDQLHEICESLKPFNLIKDVFNEVTNSPEVKKNLTNSAIGLGIGIFFKNLFLSKSHNFGKKILGTLIQISVAVIVSKHFDDIKLITKHLLNKISESDPVKKA